MCREYKVAHLLQFHCVHINTDVSFVGYDGWWFLDEVVLSVLDYLVDKFESKLQSRDQFRSTLVVYLF